MRLIPGKTKVKMELFKGVTLVDVFVVLIGVGIAALCAASSLPYRWIFALVVFGLFGMLIVRVNDEPIYIFFWHMLRYLAFPRRFYRVYDDKALKRMKKNDQDELMDAFYEEDEEEKEEAEEPDPAADKKKLKELIKEENKILKSKTATKEEKDAVWLARANRSAAKKKAKAAGKEDTKEYHDVSDFIPFTGIKDGFIEYADEYFGTVIEIDPVEFRFHSTYRRNNAIENCFGKVLRGLNGDYGANIVKLQRPIMYDDYLEAEYGKLDALKKSYESGLIREDELKARVEVEYERISEISDLCTDNRVIEGFYYFVLYDKDRRNLRMRTNQALDVFEQAELSVRNLDDRGLAIFLKYSNSLDFDEREIDQIDPEHWVQWAMPEKLKFSSRKIEINEIITHNFRVLKYPSIVGDAWLAGVMSLPGTKVVVKITPMDRSKSIRAIDRSLAELRGRYIATGIDSKRLELQTHIETLSTLLVTLQQENEALLSVNIYITAYDSLMTKEDPVLGEHFKSMVPMVPDMKKTVRHTWTEAGMKLSQMDFLQLQAFIGSQISNYDPVLKEARGIPSNTIAGMYPWIFAHISDEGGVKLGSSDGIPVFINFFRRDAERVNSNMVIVGKSGSGKSYTTKSLLLNLASEDAKIFILDPENEYSELAHNLCGRIINVGNAKYGRLNPFHIITALDDDEAGEGGGGPAGSFATHLQFLEEFFRQILPDIDKDALEYLNSLVERTYLNFGITPDTDLSGLHAEDYPIFDDLYDVILAEFERTNNDYLRQLLRMLVNYISKFSTGGRNANIWNGPSTITTDENFSVFNFQSLLANRNSTIANAQMLLVLKYIDNEIIKNRDYNLRYNLKRKIVVVIDEAHVFIDTKFPVALDFMFQLAKRIRKYNGMQIVITQNIKDFVGSEEIARKSTAIINACQYSFVFGLAPNDMDDLCRLYEKAGGINEQEQEDILSAKRGQAFAIMSPTSRSSFHIDVPDLFVNMFEKMDFQSVYFSGTDGETVWEEFVEESRSLHDTNYDERLIYEEEHPGGESYRQDEDDDELSTLNFSEVSDDEYNIGGVAPISAVDKMIAAEEAVNRREYEMATMRFGGLRLEEVDETQQPEAYDYGSINLEEVDGTQQPEAYDYGGINLEEVDGLAEDAGAGYTDGYGQNYDQNYDQNYGQGYDQRAAGYGYDNVNNGNPRDVYGGAAGVEVSAAYTEAIIDEKLNQFRASIRAEMEQELLEKLKWISIGAGLSGGGTGLAEIIAALGGNAGASAGVAADVSGTAAAAAVGAAAGVTAGTAASAGVSAAAAYGEAASGYEESTGRYTDDAFEENEDTYADDEFTVGELTNTVDEFTDEELNDEEFMDVELFDADEESMDVELSDADEESMDVELSDSDEEFMDIELSDADEEFTDDELSGEAFADDEFAEDQELEPDEEVEVNADSLFSDGLSDDMLETDSEFDEEFDEAFVEEFAEEELTEEEFAETGFGDRETEPGESYEDEFAAEEPDDLFEVDSDDLFGLDEDTDEELYDEDMDMDNTSNDFDYDLDDDPDLNEDLEFVDDEFDEDLDFDEDEDTDDDDDDFENTPFLFAELLEEAAEDYAEKDLDEIMAESGEDVMVITLDELTEYIRDLHKKKKGA